ncbi:YhcN/YlaJ family sporulation lipoprotein [uncultured Metabacillus sp.]|uniref:YhcN/YlaJ family sporulation lipoprotein n=1 Tax=uncultured Metabacillus sp. TaxID=2860135 RepID=UPI002626EB68|nr:YhcN/YlaJ family sporulation lipoprotein [uncultured Metabacillus sp.]
MRYLFAVFLITGFVLTGCAVNQGAPETDNESNKGTPIHVKNSVDETVDRKTGQQISNHLVELASKVPQVNDATAVVLGNFAVVGIDVNSNLDRNKVESIKYTVAESLMHDPYGANAIVIADADTNARLREMGREIQEGRPIAGILDELAAIVGRVVPEVPTEILDNQQKQPTNQNNDQLNQNEEEMLEKNQEKQSNNHLKK